MFSTKCEGNKSTFCFLQNMSNIIILSGVDDSFQHVALIILDDMQAGRWLIMNMEAAEFLTT